MIYILTIFIEEFIPISNDKFQQCKNRKYFCTNLVAVLTSLELKGRINCPLKDMKDSNYLIFTRLVVWRRRFFPNLIQDAPTVSNS